MPKKVLILHLAHWDQLLGGAELQLKYLSEYLIKEETDVHMLYPVRNSKSIASTSINLHPVKYTKASGTFGKTWFRYKRELKKKIGKIQPDIIITRAYSSWSGIVSEYAKIHNIRHIHFIASDNDIKNNKKLIPISKPFDYLEYKQAKKIYYGQTEIIVQNQEQKKLIYENFGLNVRMLNQAAPLNNPLTINKSNSKLKVVWIANLKSIKRPEKFLEIVNYFKNDKSIEFYMIGGHNSSEYDEMLRPFEKISNFEYLGALQNIKVNEVLDSAHILINTSDYEGFSNTFIQAWLRNVVVISLNSDPNQILTDKIIGFKTGTLDKMISILDDFKKNSSDLKEMGQKARDYAVKKHTINNQFYKLLEI